MAKLESAELWIYNKKYSAWRGGETSRAELSRFSTLVWRIPNEGGAPIHYSMDTGLQPYAPDLNRPASGEDLSGVDALSRSSSDNTVSYNKRLDSGDPSGLFRPSQGLWLPGPLPTPNRCRRSPPVRLALDADGPTPRHRCNAGHG